MFTSNENIPIKFLTCWYFRQVNPDQHMKPRKYCTLAFRNYAENGILIAGGETIKTATNMVTLVPHNLEYFRKARYDDFFAIEFEAYNYNSKKIKAVMPSNPARLQELFCKTYKCFMHPSPGYLYRCTAYFSEILELLQIEFGNPDTKISPLIVDAVNYMFENYTDQKLTVAKLSDIAHISPTYFRSLFEDAFGMSPKAYMLKLRLEHSVKLLSCSMQSIAEISAQSGFTDSRYYTTVFRRAYGLTPSVARRSEDLFNLTINKGNN